MSGRARRHQPRRGGLSAADKAARGAETPAGRALGLDDRDIPGGKTHVISHPATPDKTAVPPERDLFAPGSLLDHAVPDELAAEPGWRTPPADVERAPRPAAEPKDEDAVPVRIVEGAKARTLRTLVSDGPMLLALSDTDPQRIADRDPDRKNLYVTNESAYAGTPQQAQGSVTSPGSHATVAQIGAANIVPGVYTLQWAVDLDGTPSATDVNNFQILFAGGSVLATSENDGAVGHYTQTPFQVTVPQGAAALTIRTAAAGTAGAVYSATFTLTPVAVPAADMGVRVGPMEDVSQGRGLFIPGATGPVKFETQDALWVAPDVNAVAAVRISWGAETAVPVSGI